MNLPPVIRLAIVAGFLAGCVAAPPSLLPPPAAAPPPAVPQLGALSAAAGSTDKGPSQHNYTELYERLLFQWKNDPVKIFEIGIAEGGSLAMRQTYFPNARIFAVDILEKTRFDNARVTTLVADCLRAEEEGVTAASARPLPWPWRKCSMEPAIHAPAQWWRHPASSGAPG